MDEGFQYDGLTELIVTKDMSERKNKMIELGDAFIAFPGGTGTLEEIAEIMSKVLAGVDALRRMPHQHSGSPLRKPVTAAQYFGEFHAVKLCIFPVLMKCAVRSRPVSAAIGAWLTSVRGADQYVSLGQPGGVIQVVTRTEDGASLTGLTITGTVVIGQTKTDNIPL